MKPDNLKVFRLFERHIRYVVPLFQRPYVWTRERQWMPLWADWLTKTEEVLHASARSHQHFMGAVVLNGVRTSTRQVPMMDIVDGQQRLITLQIALFALRDVCHAHAYEALDTVLERLTSNQLGQGQDPQECYKTYPSQADRSAFASLCAGESRQGQSVLYDAYDYFYAQLNVALLPETLHAQLDAFFVALTERFELIVIELEEGDSPPQIYESLNARGEALHAADLIRNALFHEALLRGADLERLYAKTWRSFDVPAPEGRLEFWRAVERQGRLKRPRLELFWRHVLMLWTGREVSVTRLFAQFRHWLARHSDLKLEAVFAQVYSLAEWYFRLYHEQEGGRLGAFARRVRALEATACFPVVLYLLSETQVSAQERDGMLADLETYLVRRAVCGLPTSDYDALFLGVLRQVRALPRCNRPSLRHLLASLQGAARLPRQAEFSQHWLNAPVYLSVPPRALALMLEALDIQLETRKQERLHLAESVTLEHIMPQNWEDTYPLDARTSAEEVAEARFARQRLVHSFGNLTLITQPLNSALQNAAFAHKRLELARQSRLRLNVYFQQVDDVWDEEAILARGAWLLALALKLWEWDAE